MSSKNLEVKVNAFLNAVETLFHSNNPQQKKNANKFIIELEKNVDSWDIAFQILQKNDLPEEVYFNALQILKNKIKYDFGNYIENPIYINNLLNFFYTNIDTFKKYKRYLILNYCDCIGKAFIFTGDNFKNILIKFTNKLYSQNSDINDLICLLLIFNSINENSSEEKIVIDKNSREKIKSEVQNIAGDVFQFIIFMISKLDDNNIKSDLILRKFISEQILETIINYISIPLSDEIIQKFNNDYFPLVNYIFQINEESLEKQSECICYLLQFPLQNNNMINLAQFIFSKILNLKDIFYKSFDILDNDQINFYIDIFTNMVQNNLDKILEEQRYDLIQIIVDITKKCPAIKIELILEFFTEVNEFFYDKNFTIEDIMKIFKNIFINFIKNLIFLTKFDDNIFNKLNHNKTKKLESNEEYNNIIEYRYCIKPFLDDFCCHYGFYFIFNEIIFPEFNDIIEKIKHNQKDLNAWCKLENILYIFSCVIRVIDFKENNNQYLKNVNTLYYTIFDIPKEFVQIIRTITDIIENTPSQIFKEKDLLFKAFKYIINGLDDKLTLKFCSKSAKKLLVENKKIMSQQKSDLMGLYSEKLKNNVLLNDKYIDIIEGLIEVVCYNDNKDNNNNDKNIIKNCIIEIMKPWILYLDEAKKLYEKNENNINILSKDDYERLNHLLIILKYSSRAAFEGLNDDFKNIMYEIFCELWPKTIIIFEKNLTDGDLVENVIQMIKIYIKGLNMNFKQFIPKYIELIINGYRLKPISSFLYGYEILISVFKDNEYSDDEIKNILKKTFNELCKITLDGYINNSKMDEKLIIDIISDFYGLLQRMMKYNLVIILDCELFDEIIKSGLNYFNLEEIDICKNITSFFSKIIKYEDLAFFKNIKNNNNINAYQNYKNIIQKKIENFGLLLCEKILKSFLDVPTDMVLEYITELLKDLIIYQKNLVINGMKYYLKFISEDILTNKEKEEFIFLIEKFDIKEKEFDDFLYNFKNRCESKQIRDKGNNKD